MNISCNAFRRFTLIALLAAGALAVQAADYPTKPVRLVVPVAPGGPNDILARAIGGKLATSLGQPVVIENIPGAGGNLATAQLLRGAHDGYSVLLHGMNYAVNPSIFGNASPYKVNDYAAVSIVAKGPLVLVVHPGLGIQSVRDLVVAAKAKSEGIPYASGGPGSSPHLAAELFKSLAGVNLMHVQYKGTSAFMPDLLAGRVLVAFVSPLVIRPYVQAGQVIALAVTSARRNKEWDLPTVAEAGVPGYDFDAWYVILAPSGTPADVVAKLNAAISDAVRTPDIQQRWTSLGVEFVPATPAQADAYVGSEFRKWAKVVKDANIRPD